SGRRVGVRGHGQRAPVAHPARLHGRVRRGSHRPEDRRPAPAPWAPRRPGVAAVAVAGHRPRRARAHEQRRLLGAGGGRAGPSVPRPASAVGRIGVPHARPCRRRRAAGIGGGRRGGPGLARQCRRHRSRQRVPRLSPMQLDPETIYRRRWWTLAVLCLSLVMVIVGNTVLNIALPTLVKELHATNTQLQWVVDAYGLAFAGLLLTSGALGDRFGRKYALNAGLLIFGITSTFAAFSSSASQVIAARAVMGLAASLVMPATLSILTSVFPPNERARAIAIWAGLSGAGAAIGPIASGWLLEHFWWGSVFLLNTPVVVTALVAGRFLVPNSRDAHPAPLDPVGAGLSILGLATLVYAIIEAPLHGWGSASSLVAFAGAAVVLLAFALWELHTPDPMLDLRFFKQRGFSAGAGGITLNFFAMFGMFFLLTQYLQLVLGYDPLEAGVRVLPFALTIMVAAPSSARVAERIGTRGVVATGQCALGSGMLLLSTCGVHTSYGRLVVALVVMAAGTGLTVAPC